MTGKGSLSNNLYQYNTVLISHKSKISEAKCHFRAILSID